MNPDVRRLCQPLRPGAERAAFEAWLRANPEMATPEVVAEYPDQAAESAAAGPAPDVVLLKGGKPLVAIEITTADDGAAGAWGTKESAENRIARRAEHTWDITPPKAFFQRLSKSDLAALAQQVGRIDRTSAPPPEGDVQWLRVARFVKLRHDGAPLPGRRPVTHDFDEEPPEGVQRQLETSVFVSGSESDPPLRDWPQTPRGQRLFGQRIQQALHGIAERKWTRVEVFQELRAERLCGSPAVNFGWATNLRIGQVSPGTFPPALLGMLAHGIKKFQPKRWAESHVLLGWWKLYPHDPRDSWDGLMRTLPEESRAVLLGAIDRIEVVLPAAESTEGSRPQRILRVYEGVRLRT